MAWWTSNYALYPADRLLVRTSVRMTLSAPPNAYWLGTLCTDAKVIEEGSVDYEGMDPLQTEFKFFHDLHYPFTIDQFDWGCAVTQSLLLRVGGKRAGRQDDALVCSPRHCATKVTNLRCTNGAFVAFTLEDHFVAYKSIDLEDAKAIDPAIAAASRNCHFLEVRLAQQFLAKAFKPFRWQ